MDQYRLEQTIKAHLKRAGLSQRAAAQQLHYTPDQFNKWIKGVNRIPDGAVQALAELLNLSDEARLELFELAGYVALDRLSANGRGAGPRPGFEPTPEAGGPQAAVCRSAELTAKPGGAFFREAVKGWSESFFRWSEASDHMRSSWAGMVIYGSGVVIGRLGPDHWLKILAALALWTSAAWLVGPILKWPLADLETRQLACLKYGAATVLIPFVVALVTRPDRYDAYRPGTARAALTIWLLKFTGALVGFFTFSIIALALAMSWYYLFGRPLAAAVRAGLALLPLFFSYVTARRIPVDRYRLFNGAVRFHPADYLFLGVFLAAGALAALFVYVFYGFLAQPAAGFMILLVGLGIAWWEQRRGKSPAV